MVKAWKLEYVRDISDDFTLDLIGWWNVRLV
jgi:hypothetical protein